MSKLKLAKTSPPPGKRGLGKAQFISQIEEIKLALENGWSAKDIWKELFDKGSISIQYRVFSRYVSELIKGKKKRVSLAANQAAKEEPTLVEDTPLNQDEEDGPITAKAFTSSKLSMGAKHANQIQDDLI